jgi:CRP-like cAMP-binding protein
MAASRIPVSDVRHTFAVPFVTHEPEYHRGMDLLAILQRSPIFRDTPQEDLQALIASLKLRSFTRGAYLFHESDPGTQLYIVVSGQVKISRLLRGEEVVFAMLTAGDLFGELASLEDAGTRTSDAQAVETTECLSLGRDALMTFLQTHPEALQRLVSVLIAYIRRKDEAFIEVALLDIPSRVAQKLLDLAAVHGEPTADGVRIRMHLAQRTMAAMVGASRENVNRALSRLAAEGIIRQQAGQIIIVKSERLRARAQR